MVKYFGFPKQRATNRHASCARIPNAACRGFDFKVLNARTLARSGVSKLARWLAGKELSGEERNRTG